MQELYHSIEMSLQTVFDPDFPVVDIYTLGLIYSIDIDEKGKKIKIVMTFTTPVCPMADYLMESVKNAANIPAPNYEVIVETTFDPMWNPKMIRDKDLQRMFE
jgi:metal-sulfur cluster biosynthetic enzyme